ncbi:hypothetical protein [Delftia sp. 67-8]|uniref:hypothetical protein n=1 Tax=Delftia sp. 67-8 TaxID=1895749 RepID=UPI000925980F|nr:hypothetical protein [Delftia sp. 67-8]OJX11238.1 MAG: hypothetical protein BGO79_17200 [Delftia sp. 67-8]
MAPAAPRVTVPAGHQGPITVLGMDPGKHTGLAWIVDGQLQGLEEIEPAEIALVLQERRPTLVIFEDSRAARRTWTANGSDGARKKIARNVGEIDAWCKLIVGLCAALGIPCHGMPPSAKAGGAHGAKIDAATFSRLTGWAGRSNQHQRDAAMIAWSFRRARP